MSTSVPSSSAVAVNPYTQREQNHAHHLFESGTFSLYDEGDFVNLTAGAPGPDRLIKCCEVFETATKHRLSLEKADNAMLFQYGPTVGRYDYNVAVAKFLSEKYGDTVYSDDLALTTGATQGLHAILSIFLDLSHGVVFVDEVTYMLALQVFKQFHTVKVVPVPLTADGCDVQALRRLVAEHRYDATASGKPFWGIYYTIPVHHNPTGITFTSDVCEAIVSIAREFELLVVAEDVYNMLTYDAGSVAPKRLLAFDRMSDADYKGNVISNGTFSKILSPGARLGWLELPPRCMRLVSRSGIMHSGGALNNYTSGIVMSALQLDLVEDILKDNIEVYGDRMRMACKVLTENLSAECFVQVPSGGYFIWIRLPEHIDVDQLNAYGREHHNVAAISGHVFSIEGKFRNFARVSIAFYRYDRLEAALIRFCKAVNEFLAQQRGQLNK